MILSTRSAQQRDRRLALVRRFVGKNSPSDHPFVLCGPNPARVPAANRSNAVRTGVVSSEWQCSGQMVGKPEVIVRSGFLDNFRIPRNPARIDARRGDPSYKLAYQALAAFPTYR